MNRKSTLFLVTALIFFSISSFSQAWNKISSGTSANLKDVFFVNSNIGWVVGKNGLIRKTTDAGVSWTTQTSGTSQELKSAHFASADLGWIVGKEGRLLKTNNAGNSWQIKSNPSTDDLYAISFSGNSTGIAVGKNGIIITSTDAGETWALRSASFSGDLYAVQMLNTNLAFACGENGAILKTTDGGATWNIIHTSGLYNLLSLHFLTETKGYLVPESEGSGSSGNFEGSLFSSENNVLTAITLPTTQVMLDVFFIDENIGWVVGEKGRIMHTTTGGTSWTVQTLSSVDKDLEAVQFLSAQNGYAVGESGTILKYGYHPASIEEQTLLPFTVFPNPCQNELHISSTEFMNGFSVNITDITGKIILQKNINAQQTSIQTQELNAGIYILRVTNGQQAYSTKFLKNE